MTNKMVPSTSENSSQTLWEREKVFKTSGLLHCNYSKANVTIKEITLHQPYILTFGNKMTKTWFLVNQEKKSSVIHPHVVSNLYNLLSFFCWKILNCMGLWYIWVLECHRDYGFVNNHLLTTHNTLVSYWHVLDSLYNCLGHILKVTALTCPVILDWWRHTPDMSLQASYVFLQTKIQLTTQLHKITQWSKCGQNTIHLR